MLRHVQCPISVQSTSNTPQHSNAISTTPATKNATAPNSNSKSNQSNNGHKLRLTQPLKAIGKPLHALPLLKNAPHIFGGGGLGRKGGAKTSRDKMLDVKPDEGKEPIGNVGVATLEPVAPKATPEDSFVESSLEPSPVDDCNKPAIVTQKREPTV